MDFGGNERESVSLQVRCVAAIFTPFTPFIPYTLYHSGHRNPIIDNQKILTIHGNGFVRTDHPLDMRTVKISFSLRSMIVRLMATGLPWSSRIFVTMR